MIVLYHRRLSKKTAQKGTHLMSLRTSKMQLKWLRIAELVVVLVLVKVRGGTHEGSLWAVSKSYGCKRRRERECYDSSLQMGYLY